MTNRKRSQTSARGYIETVKLNPSTNGNPRYAVKFLPFDISAEGVTGNTRSDAQFCYSMPTDGPALVTYHETVTGRIVFDDIERTKGLL
jgi:hypothetical protein